MDADQAEADAAREDVVDLGVHVQAVHVEVGLDPDLRERELDGVQDAGGRLARDQRLDDVLQRCQLARDRALAVGDQVVQQGVGGVAAEPEIEGNVDVEALLVELWRLGAVAVHEAAGVAVREVRGLAELLLAVAALPSSAVVGLDEELAVGNHVVGDVVVDEDLVRPQLDLFEHADARQRAVAEVGRCRRRRRRGRRADRLEADVNCHVARKVAIDWESELEGAPRGADAGRAVARCLDASVLRCDGDVGAVGCVDIEDVGMLDVDEGRLDVRLPRGLALGADCVEALPEVVRGGEELVESLVAEDELKDGSLRHPGPAGGCCWMSAARALY